MISVTPLYPCVHPEAYVNIRDLLGEDVAYQLLYDPQEVYGNDRSDNAARPETIAGWIRARFCDHGSSSVPETIKEPAAQCP
ncbi:hypothetical protein D3C86_1860810 [compost metagenome]